MAGSSLTVDFNMGPGEQKVVRIILAWYAPEWEGNGVPGTGGERIWTYAPEGMALSTTGKRFTHMYAKRFADAGEVATYLARHHEQLLETDNRLAVGNLRQTRRCPAGWRIR